VATPVPIDTLALPAGGAPIVVVADTHGKPHPAMAERLANLRPAAILHAGDIGDPAVLDTLAAYAPVLAVRGNIDAGLPGVPDLRVVDVPDGAGGTLRILLTHIAVAGPKLRAEVGRAARDVGASLVVCGHSHVPFIGVHRGITVFNPGSVGPRRFNLPIVFGTITVTDGAVRLAHVACDTGLPWRPWPSRARHADDRAGEPRPAAGSVQDRSMNPHPPTLDGMSVQDRPMKPHPPTLDGMSVQGSRMKRHPPTLDGA